MTVQFTNSTPLFKKIAVIFLVFLFLVMLNSIAPFYTVGYGQGAVVSRFGKLDRTSEPGLHFKIPFVEVVDTYSTQKMIYETSESNEQSNADYKDVPVDTSTEDGQQLSIRYTIRFQIDPKKLTWVAQNLGTSVEIVERIVKAESRSVVRNIARKFRAQDLYTGNIFKFQEEVNALLKDRFDNNGLLLDEFLVRQMKFSPEYVSAVE